MFAPIFVYSTLVCVGVLSGFSCFLPLRKNMHVRLIDEFQIYTNVSVDGCSSPVRDSQRLSTNDSWDRLQLCNPELD